MQNDDRISQRQTSADKLKNCDILLLKCQEDDISLVLPRITKLFSYSQPYHPLLLSNQQANVIREYLHAIDVIDIGQFLSMEESGESLQIQGTTNFETASIVNRVELVLVELNRLICNLKRGETNMEFSFLASGIYAEDLKLVLPLVMMRHQDFFSIPELVEALMHLPSGCSVIASLVLNDYLCLLEVTDTIFLVLCRCNNTSDDDIVRSCALKAIISLCDAFTSAALCLRRRLIEQKILPNVVLLLTLKYLKDESLFLNSIIAESSMALSSEKSNWFWQLIATASRNSSSTSSSSCSCNGSASCSICSLVTLDPELLIYSLRKKMLQESERIGKISSRHATYELLVHLKAYCGLMGIGNLQLTDQEVISFVTAINAVITSTCSYRLVSVSFSTILLCCAMRGESMKENEKTMVTIDYCIRQLYSSDSACSVFLFVSLQLYTSQIAGVLRFLQQTLEFPAHLPEDGIAWFGGVLLKPTFTEVVMVRELVLRRSTSGFYNPSLGAASMTLRCIYILLAERSFIRHRIDPSQGLLHQLQHCELPIHCLFPAILDEFVECCLLSMESRTAVTRRKVDSGRSMVPCEGIIHRWSEAAMKKLLSPIDQHSNSSEIPTFTKKPSREFAGAILAAYFILLYNNRLKSYPAATGVMPYRLQQFPLRYLLRVAEKYSQEQEPFEYIYPGFLRLVLEECPQLVIVDTKFIETITKSYILYPSFLLDLTPSIMKARQIFTSSSPISIIRLLEHLQWIPPPKILPYFSLILEVLIPHCVIDREKHKKEFRLIEKLWNRVLPLHPSPDIPQLKLLTILGKTEKVHLHLTQEELVQEPFAVFRCNPQVFQSPPLLSMLLYILKGFLVAHRSYAFNHFDAEQKLRGVVVNPMEVPSAEPIKESKTVVLLQESVIFHCLLDIYSSNYNLLKKDFESKSESKIYQESINISLYEAEIRFLVCEFIEEMFQQDPELAKVVHEQSYDSTLLSMLLDQVPSMKICIDYLPELLQNENPIQLRFLLLLGFSLAIKYSTEWTLALTKLLIGRFQYILSSDSELNEKLDISKLLLPQFVLLLPSIPDHIEDIFEFFIYLKHSIVPLKDNSEFQNLLKKTVEESIGKIELLMDKKNEILEREKAAIEDLNKQIRNLLRNKNKERIWRRTYKHEDKRSVFYHQMLHRYGMPTKYARFAPWFYKSNKILCNPISQSIFDRIETEFLQQEDKSETESIDQLISEYKEDQKRTKDLDLPPRIMIQRDMSRAYKNCSFVVDRYNLEDVNKFPNQNDKNWNISEVEQKNGPPGFARVTSGQLESHNKHFYHHYNGRWKDGHMRGAMGVYIFADGGKYSGNWKDSLQHGQGVAEYPNGAKYTGNWLQGKYHGQGRMEYANGTKYEGMWDNGFRHGYGKITFPSGSFYEGEYFQGVRQGKGIASSSKKHSYDGEWKNQRIEGKGTITLPSGETIRKKWERGTFGETILSIKTLRQQQEYKDFMEKRNLYQVRNDLRALDLVDNYRRNKEEEEERETEQKMQELQELKEQRKEEIERRKRKDLENRSEVDEDEASSEEEAEVEQETDKEESD